MGAISADWYGSGQYVLTGRVKIGGQNGHGYPVNAKYGSAPPGVAGQRWKTGIEGVGDNRGIAGQITGKKEQTNAGERTGRRYHIHVVGGVWSFVLFNDAWSQKGHSASNTTVILA